MLTLKTLMKIEDDLSVSPFEIPDPMQADVYILASALQKAIRRGDLGTALTAAVGLWEEDRQRFYRRVHISALEDIGIGNILAVTEVLTATASSAWRRKIGDLQVALHLVRLLCHSPKSRMGDEVFIQTAKSPAFQSLRSELIVASDAELVGRIQSAFVPLIEKSIAIWALAGTRRYPSDTLPARIGTLEKVGEALHAPTLPSDFIEACLSVATRTPWPLAIQAPLILAEAQRHTLSIEGCVLQPASHVGGVPFYALDQFTRLGKKCIQKLQKSASDLMLFSASQIGHAVFYMEGCLVDGRMSCPTFDDFRQNGEIVDMEATGLCFPEYMALRHALHENWSTLENIRHEQLTRYLKEQPWKV